MRMGDKNQRVSEETTDIWRAIMRNKGKESTNMKPKSR